MTTWRPCRAMTRTHASLVLSVLAHAVLIAALARVPWTAVDAPPATQPAMVWLAELPRAETLEPAPFEAFVVPAEPPPTSPAAPDEQPGEPTADEPAETIAEPAPTEPAPPAANEEPVSEPDIDWEDLRKEAVATAIRRLQREQAVRSFGAEDEPEPIGGRPPEQSIFDAPRSSGGTGVLQPGKTRSRFGEWASELCNDLTGGGLSLFGLASVCADPPPRADYFGHLRPSYLEKMPVCNEIDIHLAADEYWPDGLDTTAVKCRLVPKDQRGAGAALEAAPAR